MARNYKRDSRGRFASTGGTGRVTGGSLKARTSLRRTRAKRKGIDPADERLSTALSRSRLKGAETRGKRRLSEARKAGRMNAKAAPGQFRRGKKMRTSIYDRSTKTGVLGKVRQSQQRKRDMREMFDRVVPPGSVKERKLTKGTRPANTMGGNIRGKMKTKTVNYGQSARITRSIGRGEMKGKRIGTSISRRKRLDRSASVARKALDVLQQQKSAMEINTRDRRRR